MENCNFGLSRTQKFFSVFWRGVDDSVLGLSYFHQTCDSWIFPCSGQAQLKKTRKNNVTSYGEIFNMGQKNWML
jgi:hypothetical protein